MNVESLKTTLMTLSTPGLATQGSGQQAAVSVNGQGVQGNTAPMDDVVSLHRQNAASDREEKKQQEQQQAVETESAQIYKYKAVFAMDKEDNVVIRFVDKDGEVVRQVPPEEYLDMISKLKDSTSHLFSTKA